MAYGHQPGRQLDCLSIAVELRKEQVVSGDGATGYKVGFSIGGGIDQDPTMAPYTYPDKGIYVTHVDADSPAEKAGLRRHDKILEINGIDFTMVTHTKAVKYIKKDLVLNVLLTRSDLIQYPGSAN